MSETLSVMKSVSFTPSQYQALEELARQDDRKFSNFIRYIAVEFAKTRGKLPQTERVEARDDDEQ